MPEVNFQPKSPKYIKYIGQCVFWFTILIKDHISAKSGCSFSATEVKKNMLFNQSTLDLIPLFLYVSIVSLGYIIPTRNQPVFALTP